MKQLFVILFLAVASVSFAQGNRIISVLTAADTSSASQTHYLYPLGGTSWATTGAIDYNAGVEFLIETDSLSGATAGTLTIEVAYDDAGTYSYAVGTLTVNGATNQQLRLEDTDFLARKIRAKIVNTAGVQSTKIQGVLVVKRKQ